jgi:phage portal protein BeeE
VSTAISFPKRAPGFLKPTPSEETKLSSMVFPSGTGMSPLYPTFGMLGANELLPQKKVDYAKEVGDGLSSSVLMAPLNWLMRTFPEAPPVVERRTKQGQWKEEFPHALTTLVENPNPYYGGLELIMATVLDLAFGNAYWIKIRNVLGEVVQLWWVPRYMMWPQWSTDGKNYLTHYDYLTFGRTQQIAPDDVVHFRFGIDPRNIRLGLSPLGSLLRDIAMDDQASEFATAILKNLGVIGVVVAPDGDVKAGGKEASKETKTFIQDHFIGENRGKALALSVPTKVNLLQYNMQGFDVSPLRDVSEERVCAALGIPAAVVGFGTGLQQTKVGATMKEMRQLAWTGGLMPMQKIVSKGIDRQLLSDKIYDGFNAYEPPPPSTRGTLRMRFDNGKVAALWEDTSAKHDRVRKDWLAGMITRAEARTETGRAASTQDQVYIQPVNVTQLDDNGNPKPLAGGDSTTNTNDSTAPTGDTTQADNANASTSEDT